MANKTMHHLTVGDNTFEIVDQSARSDATSLSAVVSANTSARHTHTNKTVLDGISATNITSWNGKATGSIADNGSGGVNVTINGTTKNVATQSDYVTLNTGATGSTVAYKDYHLGFYLDENGDLCQYEE